LHCLYFPITIRISSLCYVLCLFVSLRYARAGWRGGGILVCVCNLKFQTRLNIAVLSLLTEKSRGPWKLWVRGCVLHEHSHITQQVKVKLSLWFLTEHHAMRAHYQPRH
jgi:hypothetical protein